MPRTALTERKAIIYPTPNTQHCKITWKAMSQLGSANSSQAKMTGFFPVFLPS